MKFASFKSKIFLVYPFVKRCVRLVIQTFTVVFRATLDAFIVSRREWKTFRVSFRAARDAFTVARREAWGRFIASRRGARSKSTRRLNKARRIFEKSLGTATDSYNKARDRSRALFRHYIYRVVLVTLILGTVCVPHYQGEQDAHSFTLMNDWRSKQIVPASLSSGTIFSRQPDGQASLILLIDSIGSSIYSGSAEFLTALFFGDRNDQRHVRVTIRHDALQPETLLPKPRHTFLLGTTSSFHFFYECENDMMVKVVRAHMVLIWWARPKCEKGRPFIIPTANIASLEFNPSPGTTSTRPELQNGPPPPKNGKRDGTDGQPEQQQCQWGEKFEVTNFGIGEEVPPASGIEKVKGFVEKARRFNNNQTLQKLRLIGRADITPFQQGSSESCDLNDCLALARARWMRGQLSMNEFQTQIDPQQITIEIAGPRCTDPNVSNCDHALDRGVEVHACWASKDPEQARTPANPPR